MASCYSPHNIYSWETPTPTHTLTLIALKSHIRLPVPTVLGQMPLAGEMTPSASAVLHQISCRLVGGVAADMNLLACCEGR